MIVTVQGEQLLIWPFKPQAGVLESLEWATDVLEPYSQEQRISLNTKPRQQVQNNYLMDAQQYSRAKAFGQYWGANTFGLPIWTESTIAGIVASGASEVLFDTANADYRAGGLALLWGSDTALEVVEINTVLSDRLTLTGTTANSYTRAWVMPLRRARLLDQSINGQRAAGQYVAAGTQWFVTDTIDLSAGAVAFTTHDGYQVMEDRPIVLDSIDESVIWPQEVFDNGTGVVAIDPLRAQAFQSTVASWRNICSYDMWSLRLWLHSIRGKAKAFWMPSYNNDLLIESDIGSADTTISVYNIGFNIYYTTAEIMILLKDGTRYYRSVTGSVDSGATEDLTIAALGTTVTTAEIDMISIMTLSRFNTNRFEFNHISGNDITLRATVVEVPVPV